MKNPFKMLNNLKHRMTSPLSLSLSPWPLLVEEKSVMDWVETTVLRGPKEEKKPRYYTIPLIVTLTSMRVSLLTPKSHATTMYISIKALPNLSLSLIPPHLHHP